MEHLLDSWNEAKLLLQGCRILLCLDYDGTLTPIVRHPSLAVLSKDGKKVLESLAASGNIKICIVSGRGLREIKELVGIPQMIYVGNHGLELEGPKITHVHPEAFEAKALMGSLEQKLGIVLKDIPGVLIENKVYTLSIHYREVREEDVRTARERYQRVLKEYCAAGKVYLTEGKKVWEVRPAILWNKGSVLMWLWARLIAHDPQRIFPVFIGDDKTDEDGFRALKGKGLTVKVSERPDPESAAAYWLRSPAEVFIFLKNLQEFKKSEKGLLSSRN